MSEPDDPSPPSLARSVPPADAPLAATLRQATRRVRLLRARQAGANGLMLGAGLTATVLLAERLRLLEPDAYAVEWLLAPPLAGLILGALWGASHKVPPLALLRHLETRLDLKERLSSAYQLVTGTGEDPGFLRRQREDALAHAPDRDALRRALPFLPVPRRVYFAGAATLGAFLLWFLPTLPLFQSPAERAEKASLKRDGERLIRIARQVEKVATARKLDPAQRAAAKLARLGEEMKKGRISQQKAMMKAAKLSEELKQAQQAAAQEAAPKSLPGAASEMRKAMAAAQGMTPANAAQKENPANSDPNSLSAPQTNQGSQDKASAKRSPAQNSLNKAVEAMAQNNAPSLAEQLSKLADLASEGEPGDRAAQEQLAGQLEALASALKDTGYQGASAPLKEAGAAMKAGDMAAASAKLREAARKIAEAARNSQSAQAMQQMAQVLSGQSEGQPMEGEGFSEGGEGMGEDDAFNSDGKPKNGHVHTAECLQPGGTCAGDGNGAAGDDRNGNPNNSIGSGAGTPTTKRDPMGERTPYRDAASAPESNRYLNRKTETHELQDENLARIYAPDGKMPNTRVKGKRGAKGKETVSYIKGAPDRASATVPYYEVYGQYAPAAESALNREDIPSGYKKQVKTYFDSLKPAAGPREK